MTEQEAAKMDEYMKEKVYLTFKTDRATSELLKRIAIKMGMSQPELIDEICHDFIEHFLSFIEKDKGISNEQQQ